MKTAHVVLINEKGLVLGVSRKNDHSNFFNKDKAIEITEQGRYNIRKIIDILNKSDFETNSLIKNSDTIMSLNISK